MDAWLLLCMLFVALALFEYSVLLAIRFGTQHRVTNDDKKGSKSDALVEMKCRRIDRHALRAFTALFALTVGTYFYNTCARS